MTQNNNPTVSLGMPIYNGEDYLEDTLNTILTQTYTDFELIITDNASTDRTQEICEAYAVKDGRIRYHRNAQNLGAAPNYNLCFEMAFGKYFKWVAHDDPLAPECLAACVEVLENEPDAIMSYAKTILIDENSDLIEYHEDGFDMRSNWSHQRFHQSFHASAWCHPVFGLVRTDVLAKTGLIGNFASSDKVLLGEFAIAGKCYEVPRHLAYRRLHPNNSTEANKTDEEMASWFDPNAKRRLLTPRWLRFLEHAKSINRSAPGIHHWFLCYFELGRFYFSPGRLTGVTKDLKQLTSSVSRAVSRR